MTLKHILLELQQWFGLKMREKKFRRRFALMVCAVAAVLIAGTAVNGLMMQKQFEGMGSSSGSFENSGTSSQSGWADGGQYRDWGRRSEGQSGSSKATPGSGSKDTPASMGTGMGMEPTPLTSGIIILCLLFGIGFCSLCPVRFIMPSLAGYGSEINVIGIILAGIVTGMCFFKERIFCQLCPMGSLIGLANKISIGRIKKTGAACTKCRACLECCPMDIQIIYTEREKPDVTHEDCIYCMKCIEACPEPDALMFTMFGKRVLTSKRETRR